VFAVVEDGHPVSIRIPPHSTLQHGLEQSRRRELATESEAMTQPDSDVDAERTAARSRAAGIAAARPVSFEDSSGQRTVRCC
jgi:hypothetical protein